MVSASRSGNKYREYGPLHVWLLLLVRGHRTAGIPLDEIRQVREWMAVRPPAGPPAADLIEQQLAQVQWRALFSAGIFAVIFRSFRPASEGMRFEPRLREQLLAAWRARQLQRPTLGR